MGVPLRWNFDHFSILIDSFVGNDAAPAESFNYVLLGPWNETVGVCILDSDNEVPTPLLCVEVIV